MSDAQHIKNMLLQIIRSENVVAVSLWLNGWVRRNTSTDYPLIVWDDLRTRRHCFSNHLER